MNVNNTQNPKTPKPQNPVIFKIWKIDILIKELNMFQKSATSLFGAAPADPFNLGALGKKMPTITEQQTTPYLTGGNYQRQAPIN